MCGGCEPGAEPLTVHARWATSSEVPDTHVWLTKAERRVLAGLRVPKRRADWRLGRWVAKAAVLQALPAGRPPVGGPAAVEILAAADGAPEVRLVGGPETVVSVSLSHSEGMGFACSAAAGMALGCDVEAVAPRSDAFLADYLTPAERSAVRCADPALTDLMANLIWSAKESALKALRVGLRADTRSVEVVPAFRRDVGALDTWRALTLSGGATGRLRGSWMARGGYVWTVASSADFRILEG